MSGIKGKTTINFKDDTPQPFYGNIKETARFIIEEISKAEKFNGDIEFSRFAEFFDKNERNIKITTDEFGNNELLSLIFSTPGSVDYNEKQCYQNKLYKLPFCSGNKCVDVIYNCKLSAEWRNCKWKQSGNYLWALIKMVNNHYSDLLTIKSDFERNCC